MMAILVLCWLHGEDTSGLTLNLLVIFQYCTNGIQSLYMMSAFAVFHAYSVHIEIEKASLQNFTILSFFRIELLYYISLMLYLCYLEIYRNAGFVVYLKKLGWGNIISHYAFVKAGAYKPFTTPFTIDTFSPKLTMSLDTEMNLMNIKMDF
jgi:hypothetical protein